MTNVLASKLIAYFVAFAAAVTPVFVLADGDNILRGVVTVFDTNGNRLADRSNVVVFIDGISKVPGPNKDSQAPRISHKDALFAPRVLPITRGGVVDFFNDDDIYHNVFSLSKTKPFDLGIYPQGTTKLVTFDRAGLVKLYCNIHPDMVANILVLNNNHFAVTNADGEFKIAGLPDIQITLRAWHESGEAKPQQISMSGESILERNIEIRLTGRSAPHKNKFGKDYSKKY